MKHKHLVTSTNDHKNPRLHWPLKKVNKVWTQALFLCLWVFAIWILGLWCWNITWTWCRNSLGCGGGRPAYRLPWNNVIPRANPLWEEGVLHLKWDPRQTRVRNPLLSTILTVPKAQLGVTQPGLNPCFRKTGSSLFLLVGPQHPCCVRKPRQPDGGEPSCFHNDSSWPPRCQLALTCQPGDQAMRNMDRCPHWAQSQL